MEKFLRLKEYFDLMGMGYEKPLARPFLTSNQPQKWDTMKKLKDLKVKNYLFQSIDQAILETIFQNKTSKNIWDSMKKKYKGSTRVKRAQVQAIRRDFEVLQMQKGRDSYRLHRQGNETCKQIRIQGDKMDGVVMVEKILRSLTPKYDYIVCQLKSPTI